MGYRIDRIAQGLMRPVNPYVSLVTGAFTSAWGLWLLMPWSVFGSAPLYSKMGDFAPEWAWGAWAYTAGMFIILAVQKGLYKTLLSSFAFSTWHWGTVALFMWFGDWHNTGGLTYSFITLYCAVIYMNLKHNFDRDGENAPNFYS